MVDSVTYYYLTLNPTSKSHWINYANMVSNPPDLALWAYSDTNANMEQLMGSQCNGSDLGVISKVGLKAYTKHFRTAGGLTLRPYFGGTTFGTTSSVFTSTSDTGAWTTEYNITNDAAGPGAGNWTWTDIQNLDVVVLSVISANNIYCSAVVIYVEYEATLEDCTEAGDIAIATSNYNNELHLNRTNYDNELRLRSTCC